MPSQNVNSLPSILIGCFGGEIGQKMAKTTTILKMISPNLAIIFREKFGMA